MSDFAKKLQENIGTGMRDARKAAHLTQEAAAGRIGVSVEFYSRVERGNGLPSVSTLGKIVDQLDTSADVLLDVGTLMELQPEPEEQHPPALRRLHRALRAANPAHLAKVRALLDLLEGPDEEGDEALDDVAVPSAPPHRTSKPPRGEPGPVVRCGPCKGEGMVLGTPCGACGGLGLVREAAQ